MSEFDAALREQEGSQLTFELGGRTWRCRRRLPFGLVGNLASKLDETGGAVFEAFVDLVVKAVVPDEREALRETIYAVPEDDDEVVEFGDLTRVAGLIVERATGSPFGSASGSPATPSRNGGMSLVPAASEGSTSRPHRHVKL